MSQVTREHFLRAFRRLATSEVSAELAGEILFLPTLGVSISVGAIEANAETNVVSVEIFAAHDRLPVPAGAVLVGFGDNLPAAANEAAEQWFNFFFPVLHSVLADPAPMKPKDTVFVEALMHELTGESAQRVPFWLDSFVARHADETIHVDCRLLNEHWPEAEDRLRTKAAALVPSNSGFISYRQYVFFEPTSFEAPLPGPKKSWLGRLIGVG